MKHWRKIAARWQEDKPAVSINCCRCQHPTMVDPIDIHFAICERCHEPIHDAEFIAEILERENVLYEKRYALWGVLGVVYYMKFGDRVKIGYTSDLRARALAVPHDEVLAAEPGGFDTERQRHREFANVKIPSFKEWFRHEGDLVSHTARMRAEHGDPFELSAAQAERRKQVGAA